MPNIKQVYCRHAHHFQSVLSTANKLYSQGGETTQQGFELFDLNRDNIEAGQQWATSQAKSDSEAAIICNNLPKSGGYVLYLRLTASSMQRWLEAALLAARQLNDRKMEVTHLGNLGNAYRDQGDTHKAINLYFQQLEIVKKLGDHKNEAITLNNLGSAYEALGDIHRAIDFYNQSFDLYRSLSEQPGLAIVTSNLGSAYVSIGNFEEGIELNRQALINAANAGDLRTEALILRNLASICRQKDDLEGAIKYYERTLAIHNKLSYQRGVADTLSNMGMCYIALENFDKGIEMCEHSIGLFRQVGDGNCADTVQSLICIARSVKELTNAAIHNLNSLYEEMLKVTGR